MKRPVQVGLWTVSLEVTDDELAGLLAPLSDEERDRASRDDGSPASRRRAIRRAWLRRVLGEHLGADPASLRFLYGAFGKPRLADEPGVHVTMSATDCVGVVAVAPVLVGVDVEHVSSRPATGESLQVWTAREAYTKAVGCGLGTRLDLDLDLGPDGGPRLVGAGNDDAAIWTLAAVRPAPYLLGTVAVRAPAADVRLHTAPASPVGSR